MRDTGQPTVLTVNDNDALRYSVARCLKDGGYNVTEARTGREALKLARQNPALITLDINLPDMDGFEVCRQLKENPDTAHIPILHLSASFQETEHRVRGLDGGADGYLVEPLNPEELLATVRTLIRTRESEKEARRQAQEADKIKEQLRSVNQELEQRVRERTRELARRNSEVQELSRRLLRAQDEERRRLSRELHDSTGQLLVTLTMNLSLLKLESVPNSESERLIREINSMVEEISRQVRTISYLLHPPLLDEAGLVSAVSWYVEGFSQRSNIQVGLELPADMDRLSPDMEITIFRIIQESLTNIHRHSGSQTANVRLVRQPNQVTLQISDQGKGFVAPTESDNGEPAFRPGVGILGMKERVRQFGGTFNISSAGSGTATVVTLPVLFDKTGASTGKT